MISIIDYGLGNVQAFVNVYQRLDIAVNIAKSINDLRDTSKLILPGVGSFDTAMQKFNSSGLRDGVEKMVMEHKMPILGICVGMQMLANSSDEGGMPGLGWVDGKVVKFDKLKNSSNQIVPHMGWNKIEPKLNEDLFKNMDGNFRFYFLHSYFFDCLNESNVLSTTDYGFKFTSSVKKNNIYGVQFHPEKSHHFGVQLLQNFSNI